MNEKRIRNYEVKCLLQMLETIISGEELPKWNKQPEWGSLYKLSDYHGVANMVYYAVLGMEGEKLAPWKPKFEERFHQAVLAEERYSSAVPELLNELEDRKIHAAVLQEYRMRAFYPQQDMRGLKCVSLLVEKGKEEKLGEALAYLDYEKKESRTEGEEWYYKIPGVLIIIRTELPFTNRKMQKYFAVPVKSYEKERGHKYIHTFLPEEYYIHIIGCSAEQYARGSLDIRDMADLWLYYLKVYRDLDWKVINKELEYLKLVEFHVYLIQLAAYWFGGMLFPENDAVFDAMEKYILTKGMQGRKISATLLPLVKEVADFYRKDLKRKRREQMLDWAFPHMDYMNTMFPFLHRAAWLLPVCWLLRLARMGGRQAYVTVAERKRRARRAWEAFWDPKAEAVRSVIGPRKDHLEKKIRNFRRKSFGLAEDVRFKLAKQVQKLKRKT